MKESGVIQVDSTDIGASGHFLVWIELGRTTKCIKKGKRVIRRWCLDRFVDDDDVKVKYRDALQAEVSGFAESIKHKQITGSELVNEVLEEWEIIVNRVAKTEVGEKMIVCGRAARWWDDEVRAKIEHRREVYRLIASGQEELWEEYYRLRKEVKQLVLKKKLSIWNEVV